MPDSPHTDNDEAAPVAILTGAGSGIGRAAALRLASSGWGVALAGRRAEALRETQSLAADQGIAGADETLLVAPTDVASASSCAALVQATVARFGRVDALINNAGYAPAVPIDATTPEIVDAVFAVNALGPAYLILHSWPVFARQGAGRIVNISTMGVFDPFPGLFAYAGAKASLHTFTKSCAAEGAAIGVKAFAIAPSAVETAMLRGIVTQEQLPTAETLAPSAVARVIVACAAGERDARNGEVIELDVGNDQSINKR